MKFSSRVFLWIGASLVLASAFPAGHQPTNLTSRYDGDAYGAVAVRNVEDNVYQREFEDLKERDYELEGRIYEHVQLDYYELEERNYVLDERTSELAKRRLYDLFDGRDVENVLQERQVQVAVKIAEGLVKGITKIVNLIKGKIQRDKDVRA